MSRSALVDHAFSQGSFAQLVHPLDELLDNQSLLLNAATKAKNALVNMDKPDQIAREVVANSPQRNVLTRNNVDPETFVSLLLRKHNSMINSIAEIQSGNDVDKAKKIGEVYDRTRAEFFTELGSYCENPEEFSQIETQVTRAIVSPSSSALIFQSLYVLSFAHFEHFLSGLTAATLYSRDEILGELQEKFSWAEIRQPESVKLIKSQLIGKMVNNLVKQSMKRWIDWYSKKNKMELPEKFSDECLRLYELRNLFIHEKSVRAMYMQVANFALVQRACDQLAALAVHMTESAAIASSEPKSKQIFFGQLTRLEVRLLDEGRLATVKHMCSRAFYNNGVHSDIEIHKVNSWIARKREGETESLFDELRTWDAEAFGPEFSLAKLILLDELEAAKIEAQSLVSHGLLSQEQWDAWPLFNGLRMSDPSDYSG